MNRVFVTGVGARRAPKGWIVLSEGSTLHTGARDFRDSFGSEPTTLEADLLRLAAAVFAADRACARGEREDIGRQIELSVPVTNIAVLLPLAIGAFSTHTAHPHGLVAMTNLMTMPLRSPLVVQNPYVYRTKREVVVPIVATAADLIPTATSCWRNARLRAGVPPATNRSAFCASTAPAGWGGPHYGGGLLGLVLIILLILWLTGNLGGGPMMR